jgi:hypothetical protein
MRLLRDARQLTNYILSLPNFGFSVKQFTGYGHMGAVITDTILQPGLNYRTVVAPRVKSVIVRYPTAQTTSAFLAVIKTDGVGYVLNWQHPEKLSRTQHLTRFLVNANVDTEEQLKSWLLHPANCLSLLEIRGIGAKTVDYLKNLVGISTVAVDRHIRNFVANAGIQCKDYSEVRLVVEFAADLLGIPRCSLDRAIWSYMANKEQRFFHRL